MFLFTLPQSGLVHSLFFAVYECPSEDTIKLDSSNPDDFDVDVNTPPGETFDEDSENVLRGSNNEIPLTPLEEISIESSRGPEDDFRVMELEFNVTPDDGESQVTVTVTFVLENETSVPVIVTVSYCVKLFDRAHNKSLYTDDMNDLPIIL